MDVQELIEELSKITDKSKKVVFKLADGSYSAIDFVEPFYGSLEDPKTKQNIEVIVVS